MDKDKIIKALECYCESDSFDEPNCKDCPAECMSGYMSIPFIQQVLALLKEQEERKGNYVPCKVKTPTGKWNGEKCSVCGTEHIGSAPLQWKFCPDCGAKMEGR